MKGNVMWMSDSFNAPSGFGQQTFHVCSRLTSGERPIHIDNIGWQWAGNPALFNDNWRVLPSGGRFARDIISHHMKIYKPDLLITLADLWNVQYIINLRRDYDFKWLQWLPIDGKPLSDIKWTSGYNGVDVIVAMSDFGYNELVDGKKRWVEKLEREDPPTQLEKIYHGVNTDILRPYDEEHRLALRREYDWQDDFAFPSEIRSSFIKGEKKLEDQFIYGIVARNQPRKNYPWLLQAWAEFAELHDDVLLWVHATPADPAGHNLHFIMDQLGISDSVIFSDSVSKWYGKQSSEMADVFNLFDVHFLPTAGEGFGIPTVEAMACGIPIAVTGFTTGTELTDNGRCGYLMKCDRLAIDPGHVYRVKYTSDEILGHLEDVFNMSDSTRQIMASRARDRAVERYNADNIARQWLELIEKYMSDVPQEQRVTRDIQLHYDWSYMKIREWDAQVEYAKNEYRFIGKYLTEGDDVLEVGCGSGEGMIFLSRHFEVTVRGIDVAEESIKMCRKKGLYVMQHDANEQLPFENDSFDVVYSQHVIEHLDEDMTAILDSLRVARQYAIHVVPHDNMRDPEHKRLYIESSVNELMSSVQTAARMYTKDLKLHLHKNFVADANFDRNLVSYIMVFEKV